MNQFEMSMVGHNRNQVNISIIRKQRTKIDNRLYLAESEEYYHHISERAKFKWGGQDRKWILQSKDPYHMVNNFHF